MDELSIKQIKNDPEQQKWLDEHIILNKRFVNEAKKYGIKPITNEFWVYHQHRAYEEFGKYGYCVAGIDRMAEDCELTKKQVLKAYEGLMEKNAIFHVWSDTKVYRNKTKIYISRELIEEKRLEITEKMLAKTNRKLISDEDEALGLDEESPKRDSDSPKRDSESPKGDLNNYNKQLEVNSCSSSGGSHTDDYDNLALSKIREFQLAYGLDVRASKTIFFQLIETFNGFYKFSHISQDEIKLSLLEYLTFVNDYQKFEDYEEIMFPPYENKNDFVLVDRFYEIVKEKRKSNGS